VAGVYDVSALNIRLPTHIKSVGEPICKLIRAMRERKGVLIYSPPGVGKTTLLRSVAYKMASGISPWRVSIIDTRGELALSFDGSGATVDLLTGYPKSVGIEIAARTMNPELMVCDEIGDAEEARAIIGAQNCGVPLLASAHGADLGGLLRRTGIRELHIAGVFGAYVGIERVRNESEYRYKINTAREADRYL
jgi:stage III sporulation protein AA